MYLHYVSRLWMRNCCVPVSRDVKVSRPLFGLSLYSRYELTCKGHSTEKAQDPVT